MWNNYVINTRTHFRKINKKSITSQLHVYERLCKRNKIKGNVATWINLCGLYRGENNRRQLEDIYRLRCDFQQQTRSENSCKILFSTSLKKLKMSFKETIKDMLVTSRKKQPKRSKNNCKVLKPTSLKKKIRMCFQKETIKDVLVWPVAKYWKFHKYNAVSSELILNLYETSSIHFFTWPC